jgi:hypothetical protein
MQATITRLGAKDIEVRDDDLTSVLTHPLRVYGSTACLPAQLA